jgi:cytochrome P450
VRDLHYCDPMGDLMFDPYAPALAVDPYESYQALRSKAPVCYLGDYDAWVLSRHADVKAALADNETFCSGGGLLLIRQTADYEAPHFPPGNLLLMDPPEHTAYRKLVSRRFLQRGVSELEARIRAVANHLVDQFVARGSGDLVTEFSVLLPAVIFGDILGIPSGEVGQFQTWSATLVAPAPNAEAMAAHKDAERAVAEFFARLLQDKRTRSADDLLSEIANGDIDGSPIGDEEFVGFAISMLIAGNDTTSNVLSNGAWLLDTYPEQRALLRDDPSLLAGAVEEVLRYEPPVHGLARTLTRDIEIHGQQLRKGQKVLLLFASANRDEREFVDPERFEIRRRADSHLSFGFGIHHCVGLHLGRLESRIGLETLLTRLPDYRVTIDAPTWRQTIPTRSMLALPIEFTPQARSAKDASP